MDAILKDMLNGRVDTVEFSGGHDDDLRRAQSLLLDSKFLSMLV